MEQIPTIKLSRSWKDLLKELDRVESELDGKLAHHVSARRWFGSKVRKIRRTRIYEAFRLAEDDAGFFALVRVDFEEGTPENYSLPLAFAPQSGSQPDAKAQVARIEGAEKGVLYDALTDPGFCSKLLEAIGRNQRFHGKRGEVRASSMSNFAAQRGTGPLVPNIGKAEQSNTSVIFGDRLILKIFRRLQEGINPELEIGRFLTEQHFSHTCPLVGAIEYHDPDVREPVTLAILQGFVANHGDAWKFTLDKLGRYAEAVAARRTEEADIPQQHLLDLSARKTPELARQAIGDYLDAAGLLGRRTAELHLALAGPTEDPAFRPERFSAEYQQGLVKQLNDAVRRIFKEVLDHLDTIPEDMRDGTREVLEHVSIIQDRFKVLHERPLSGVRCRCHGDYHLGQVLYTGNDFTIIDFEGEPVRPLEERRAKHSPLRDLAGMIRSFDYAAHSVEIAEEWHRFWYTWVSATFLRAYQERAATGHFLPASAEELKLLLDHHLLEKAVYELSYELNHRPDWAGIPLQGIMRLLGIAC